MPDAPRLLKTVRNAWYNSQAHRTRNLVVWNIIILFNISICSCYQNNGCEIKWAHLVELCEKTVANTGLYIGNLKREHLNLTSYSRMNVRLAAQVCICLFLQTLVYMYVYNYCT